MRPGSVETYAERIARVIEFIGTSIQQRRVPSLADMAGVAALSECHFHRVFRLMAGETPAEAVSRIRLCAALGHLERGDLAGAVDASGYATNQAFARAIKERVGASPSQLRADRGLLARTRTRLSAPQASPAARPAPLTVEIATVQPIRLVTRRNVGDLKDLNIAYGLLFKAICEHLDAGEITGIYGIPWDDPASVPADHCRFDCAFAVGEPARLAGVLDQWEIAAGPYAGLRHLGNYDDIHVTLDELYSWAIRQGHRIADRPVFIQYFDDPEVVAPPEQRATTWLPLEESAR